MTLNAKIGCGQITWHHHLAPKVTEDEVLADIAGAGYAGAPFGGQRSAEEIREAYAKHGLVAAPGYFGADFWEADKRQEFIDRAHNMGKISAELGVTELYVAAGGFGGKKTRLGRTRADVVAHSEPEDSLTDAEFADLATTLQAVGEATLEHGVRICYHNHGGTFIEREDEIERLLDAVDPEVLFLGPDTGHLAWGGVDVVAFARKHADRIKTLHLKDIVEATRVQGVTEGWDYGTYEQHAIWTELGQGAVDFKGLFDVLSGVDFDGWLIVETDVTQLPSAAESAQVSREYLHTLGL